MLATALVVILSLTGCSEYNDQRGKGDAPVENREGDDKAAVVINFPDTFANVAIKCYAGTAIISTTREAPVNVIPDSTFCRGDEVVKLEGQG